MWDYPAARWGFVLLVGACLWSVTGWRESADGHAKVEVPQQVRAELSAAPVPRLPRRLPHRAASAQPAIGDRPIQADFETEPHAGAGTVHAAGFSAEVTANSPAWLTGTIEVDE